MRLDAYISRLGLLTRSESRKTIKKWWRRVNGVEVFSHKEPIDLGDILEHKEEKIEVRDEVTVLLHKPAWYVSSDVAEWWHESYRDLLADCPYHETLHVAWRLDVDTEWLLVCTSDGWLNHRVISPKHTWTKKYYVRAEKEILDAAWEELAAGVVLDDGYTTKPAKWERITPTEIYLYLTEGKFHQVKRMLESVENKVVYLKREAVGEWTLEWLDIWKRKYISEA